MFGDNQPVTNDAAPDDTYQKWGHSMRHVEKRLGPRLRRWRLVAAGSSALTVLVALLGAVGILPVQTVTVAASASHSNIGERTRTVADRSGRAEPTPTSDGGDAGSSKTPDPVPAPTETPDATPGSGADDTLPTDLDTGSGKRVVYALKANRVWLVNANDSVQRTYLVSGTKFGQLEAGSYDVIRTRRHTTSYHGTERMQYMVTFTFGKTAAIGFHDIPISISNDKPVQTLDQLGQSLSDGCVRQARPDAKALWDFAPPGTPVIVLP
ncbi:L,D-transpeptidase [Actinopolymorpha alba]|uniref:L,D-transpeptidase n=1 Tax=Actinopolymorpha alba TaxID=533267 RepID=UPI00037D8F25|nr:L,D-transpeptidase [Actinopolymorpha alba]